MKKSHLIFSVVAVLLFIVFLFLSLNAGATDTTTTSELETKILEQKKIISQTESDYSAGLISEEKALDIITEAQGVIDGLNKEIGKKDNTTPGLSGYAWSENIGWISFSGVAQDGEPYGVELNPDTYFNSKAWSSNVGWIQFDRDLVGPDGSSGAKYDESTGQIKGWAYIPSLSDDSECDPPGTTCAQDWADGWINFSGKAQDGSLYGVTFDLDTGAIAGDLGSLKNPNRWAWGGNGIGWIDFSGVILNDDVPSTASVSLTASPIGIQVGETTTLTCSGTNIDPAVPCEASNGAGGWSGQQMSCNGDHFTTTSINTIGSLSFDIFCKDTQGNKVYGNAIVGVSTHTPTIILSSSCDADLGRVNFKGSTNIATGSPCSSSPANSLWSTLPSVGSSITGLPTGSHTYSLTCTDSVNGPATASVTTQCPSSSTSGKKIPGYIER